MQLVKGSEEHPSGVYRMSLEEAECNRNKDDQDRGME